MSRNPPNWLLEEEQRFRRIFSVPGCNQIGRWIKLRISSPTFGSGDFRLGGGRSYHLGSCTHSWHGFWESGEWFGEVAGWLVAWGFRGGGYLGERVRGFCGPWPSNLVLYFVTLSPKIMEVEHVCCIWKVTVLSGGRPILFSLPRLLSEEGLNRCHIHTYIRIIFPMWIWYNHI